MMRLYLRRINVQVQAILAAHEDIGYLINEQILLNAHRRFGRCIQHPSPGSYRFWSLKYLENNIIYDYGLDSGLKPVKLSVSVFNFFDIGYKLSSLIIIVVD